jgi:hypothetical protein
MLRNPDKINRYSFSRNPNPKAVEYLLRNPDKIYWYSFSENSAIFDFNKSRHKKMMKTYNFFYYKN